MLVLMLAVVAAAELVEDEGQIRDDLIDAILVAEEDSDYSGRIVEDGLENSERVAIHACLRLFEVFSLLA
jgi:hypothetical protein